MKTKIANRLSLFLIGICAILLLILVIRDKKAEDDRESNRRTPVVCAIEKAMPSVVNLTAQYVYDENASGKEIRPLKTQMPEETDSCESTSIGSGSIIDPVGFVLTNAHVVHNASEIHVRLNSGMTCSAVVIAEDVLNDIALLKIREPHAMLPAIRTVRPGELLLGETVIAVGNPFGLDGSISVGVLSGVNRSMTYGSRMLFSDLLQTDAAVFPGNSGGPLINIEGSMIGMNMAIRRNSPGIGFAIPLLRIENSLAALMLPEKMRSLSLGIQPAMKEDGTVFVNKVFPESPAAEAGILPGMVIESFQGWNPAGSLLEMLRRMIRIVPREPLKLELSGIGEITLTPVSMNRNGIDTAERMLGLKLLPMTDTISKNLNYPVNSGFIISGVQSRGPSRVLKRGDILLQLGEFYMYTQDDLIRALAGHQPGDTIPATVLTIEDSPENGKQLVKRIFTLTIL